MTQLNSYASEFPFPRLSMHPPAQLGVRLIDVAIVLTIIPKSNYYQSLPARLVHTSRYSILERGRLHNCHHAANLGDHVLVQGSIYYLLHTYIYSDHITSNTATKTFFPSPKLTVEDCLLATQQ